MKSGVFLNNLQSIVSKVWVLVATMVVRAHFGDKHDSGEVYVSLHVAGLNSHTFASLWVAFFAYRIIAIVFMETI